MRAELCLISTVCNAAPAPQARDRLWGCGRADYRPVPLGVDAILPLPFLFYLRDLRWGVGMHGGAGLICVKQGPNKIMGNYMGLGLQSVTTRCLLATP